MLREYQHYKSQNSCFGREFHPLLTNIICKERTSELKTPNFGELKQRCLTLAKRRLYKNELYGKFLKAPKDGAVESLIRSSFLYNHL